jgi:multisubunit Na+/H+ antiporter MnhB subunit
MTQVFDIAIVSALVTLAVAVAAVREDRDAIVAFIAVGIVIGLAWVRLSAIDVALTEVAIGGGATGLLLLRAEAYLHRAPGPASALATARSGRWLTAAGCVAIAADVAFVVLNLPTPAPSQAGLVAENLDATGLGNPVTAVLLAYRGLDTLLEKVVLLVALAGLWSLASDRAWGGAPDLAPDVVPEPLTYLARVLPPFGIVLAIYVFWTGADSPGGTFQAGTILAAMWVLVMMAGLATPPEGRSCALRSALVFGPVVFLFVGLIGFAVSGAFLAYPPGFEKPVILGIEAALTLSVAATLAMLVAGPARRTTKS